MAVRGKQEGRKGGKEGGRKEEEGRVGRKKRKKVKGGILEYVLEQQSTCLT